MSTNTFKRYEKMVQDICQRPITEREIISAKSALRNGSHELRCLLEGSLLYDGAVICDITPEQTAKGTVWLFTHRHRAECRFLTSEDRIMLEDFQGFKFCGFHMVTGNGFYPSFLPVYRVLSTRQRWFDYTYDMQHVRVLQRGAYASC